MSTLKKTTLIFYCLFSFHSFAEKSIKIINRTEKTLLLYFLPRTTNLSFKKVLSPQLCPESEKTYLKKDPRFSLKRKGEILFEIPGNELLDQANSAYVTMPRGSYEKARKRILKNKNETFRIYRVPLLWSEEKSYKFSDQESYVFEVSKGSGENSFILKEINS